MDPALLLSAVVVLVMLGTLVASWLQSRPVAAASIAEMQKERIGMLEAERKDLRSQLTKERRCCRDRTRERDKLLHDNAAQLARAERAEAALLEGKG